MASSAGPEIERLIQLLSRLPGLGPRSGRRVALTLLKRKDQLLIPLAEAMAAAAASVRPCGQCGALDTCDPCQICADLSRDPALLMVVEEVGALWAMERSSAFRGRYHVLGGLLSALDGVGPDTLRISSLIERANAEAVREVILALPATVDGLTTAHYVAERLSSSTVVITSLARGVPVGGELDWLDDGTIAQALRARR
jgi:recombination protein RecR